jgi:pimeloyl-ACP methyl ester carboxylesterase
MAAALRTRELRVHGIRSPMIEAGSPEAPEAAVFVHGNPGSSRDWERLVAAVGEHGRALALDMPGFGRADKPLDFDYTVGGYAAFLAGALRGLGVERAHIVGHDFGGPFALAWAAANPDSFASAVMINTGVLLGYRWHALARIWRTPLAGELFQATATRAGFRLLLRRGNPRGLPREFIDRMYDDYDRATRRAVLRLYRSTPPGFGEALAPRLRELDRPALVLWGAADPYIPVEQAERQRESFPRAEVIVLERSGHWPFVDDPEAVERALVPFLRERLGTGPHAGRPKAAHPPRD